MTKLVLLTALHCVLIPESHSQTGCLVTTYYLSVHNEESSSAEVTSYNYPDYYPLNQCVIYVIATLDTNLPISLQFTDINIEPEYDNLNVIDAWTLLGNFSGEYTPSELPETMIATSGWMTLEFRSDETASYKGFHAIASINSGQEVPTSTVKNEENGPTSVTMNNQ